MYTYYYQIGTIPQNDKYCIRKLVYNETNLVKIETFYSNVNKLNILISSIGENQYKKYNTDNLEDVSKNFFDDENIFKPGSFDEKILIKNHFPR